MKFSLKKVATTLGAGATISMLMAQGAMAAIDTIPSLSPTEGTSLKLSDVIKNGVNIFLWVVGLLAVLYLIYGGVLYITAGGDAEKANKGRTAITNAIIGIVIVMLALVIFSTAVNLGSGGTGDIQF